MDIDVVMADLRKLKERVAKLEAEVFPPEDESEAKQAEPGGIVGPGAEQKAAGSEAEKTTG